MLLPGILQADAQSKQVKEKITGKKTGVERGTINGTRKGAGGTFITIR